MGFSYQELKSIKKKSIILEKQENLEIQQNSTKFRQRKRTFTKERFYGTKEDLPKSKENTRSNLDLTKQTDGSPKSVLESLKTDKDQQQVVRDKVLDTSQQLSHLEETINHEIQKLKHQRSLLKADRHNMERKRNKKPGNDVKEPSTWAKYLEDNNSKERQGNSRGISKERFSLQHKCICTSPRYGSDKNLSARPRMRSVASQIQAQEEFLDQGAVGDHKSLTNLQSLKDNELTVLKEILKYPDSQILKQNDQIVNCCYGLPCPATCQQTVTTTAAANAESCRHYSYQQGGIDRNREYNYCRDEYYYNMPNCSCNSPCRSRSKHSLAASQYRRQSTDLNTQDFYYRSPDKSANKSCKTRSNSKTKKNSKPIKTKESLEQYNNGKKRECFQKREKQQRSKSAEQRSCKSAKLSQLLSEESALKLIKYLDRYVDDYDKEFNLKGTKQNSEDSCGSQTVKIKSHTKLCQVRVRKKQQEEKYLKDFKDCGGDSNSLDTQYSWATLSMLKKMTIREYKPLKAKENRYLAKTKTTKDLEINKQEKVQRYRDYLNKYEAEQKAKKTIQVLKSPPEYFPEQESEEVDIFKEKAQTSREARERLTNSDQWELFREREINSSLINKAKFSYDLSDEKTFPASDSYEELRYECGAAARAADSWQNYKKYGEQERERRASVDPRARAALNYDHDLRESKGDKYCQDNGRESTARDQKAEEQRSKMADKQTNKSIYKESKDRERRAEDDSRAGSAAIPDTNIQISRPASLTEDTDLYGEAGNRERKSKDPCVKYYEDNRRSDVRETKPYPIGNLSPTALEREKFESEYDDETFRKSRERRRKSQDQCSKYFENGIRYSKEAKQQPIKNINQTASEKVEGEAEYDDENFRQSKAKQRKSQDQSSRCDENGRRPSTDTNQHPNKKFNLTASERIKREAEYDNDQIFRQSREKERKSQEQSPADDLKRRDFREPKVEAKFYEESFKESKVKPRKVKGQSSRYSEDKRKDLEDQCFKYCEDSRRGSIRGRKYPDELRNYKEDVKRKASEDQSSKYFEDSRRDSIKERKHCLELLNYVEDAEENVDETFRESRGKSQIAEEQRSRYFEDKIKDFEDPNHKDSRKNSKDSNEYPIDVLNKRGYCAEYDEALGEETKNFEANVPKPRAKYYEDIRGKSEDYDQRIKDQFESQEKNHLTRSSFLKKETQESPRFSEDFVDNKVTRTSSSHQKEYQAYPLKQEQLMPESFPNQNDQIDHDSKSYQGEQLKGLAKRSNSSSYNDFKQVMDHSLGFYTSRASQTDYHFKPELNEQLSSQTFTREKETSIIDHDQKENRENLQNDQPSLIPINTADALEYLKDFLKTYQDTGLEGECVQAVTSAANELITKLSSCKSSLETENNSRREVKDERSSLEEKVSLMLEQKLTQDTQYTDLESTTDSSDPQLSKSPVNGEDSKILTAESQKSVSQDLNALPNTNVEDLVQNVPIMELLEHESYHFQSQPYDVQLQWESTETYHRYEEYKEHLPDLRTREEITDEQEYLRPSQTTNGSLLNDMEMNDQLPLSYAESCVKPCMDRESIYRPLHGPSRLQAFDPQLMPLKGILKPCRVMEDHQIGSYDLESHRTTSVVSFGSRDEININRDTTMICKLGEGERAQHYNETQQTIITKDEILHPITQQTNYHLMESTTTKQSIYQDNQLDSLSALESNSCNNSPHLYTVELEKYKQCPCMLDTYMTMLNNYYKGKKI